MQFILKKKWIKWVFQNFRLVFDGGFFSKSKIFENFHIQPPKFISSICSKQPKGKLHEGFIPLATSLDKTANLQSCGGLIQPRLYILGWPLWYVS